MYFGPAADFPGRLELHATVVQSFAALIHFCHDIAHGFSFQGV